MNTPRRSLKQRLRVDPAEVASPAGSPSCRTVILQNHATDSQGTPCRAYANQYYTPGLRRSASEGAGAHRLRTDPITFSLDLDDVTVVRRTFRRGGYNFAAASSRWSLATAAETEAAAASASYTPRAPLTASPAETQALKLNKRVHTSPCGGTWLHIAGGEDLLPAGTRNWLPCEEPPSPQTIHLNSKKALFPHERQAAELAEIAVRKADSQTRQKDSGTSTPVRKEPSSPKVADAFFTTWTEQPIKYDRLAEVQHEGKGNPKNATSPTMRSVFQTAATEEQKPKPLRLFRDPCRTFDRIGTVASVATKAARRQR